MVEKSNSTKLYFLNWRNILLDTSISYFWVVGTHSTILFFLLPQFSLFITIHNSLCNGSSSDWAKFFSFLLKKVVISFYVGPLMLILFLLWFLWHLLIDQNEIHVFRSMGSRSMCKSVIFLWFLVFLQNFMLRWPAFLWCFVNGYFFL